VNDQHGTPTYAGDLAAVCIKLLKKINSFGGVRIYNYSNDGITNWCEFAKEIITLSGLSCHVVPVTTKEYGLSKAARPGYSLLDKSKIMEDLNIDIPDWKESLKKCIDNIENNK
jgi:dTDP-4-dehydrorhamnose reductase